MLSRMRAPLAGRVLLGMVAGRARALRNGL